MALLSSRARMLGALEGRLPDRVPVTAWIDGPFLTRIVGRPDFDVWRETIRVSEELGLDVSLRVYLREVDSCETTGWRLRTRVQETSHGRVRIRVIETPEGELREVVRTVVDETGLAFSHTEEHMVKSPADLDLMQKYGVRRPPVDDRPLAEAMAAIGEHGIVVCYAGGAAHTTAALCLRGLERLTMDASEDVGFYRALLEWAIRYEEGLLDVVARWKPDLCQVGGLYAQGNFVGPRFYRDLVLPYDRRFIAEVRRRDLRVTYHNCGTSARLLDLYRDLGMDAFETFPPPPLGDGDVRIVKEKLGEGTVLIGNIDQVHVLRRASPAAVRETAAEAIRAGKSGGRFILSPADQLPFDTPPANVQAMAQAATEYGRYH